MKGILYVVATPIGNLEDITLRAINVLKNVDLIAAEDTRHTLKLLNHLEISKPLISYHRHNEENRQDIIIEKLLEGQNIAIVSDAGTPGICDPGEVVIKTCIENNINVIPIPGACAMINALIVSGISTKEFNFLGFLPLNKKTRKQKLLEIEKCTKTIIIYEAPHKLKSTLQDLKDILGERKLVLARELTKIHEEFIREDIDKLIQNKSEDDIFDLVEYISIRRVEKAIDLLDELLFKADQHMLIISSIGNHFKRLYEIKVYLGRGKRLDFFMSKYRLPQFVCEKLMNQASKFSIKQLSELIKVCVNTETKLKSSTTDKQIEMELMLFKTFMVK